MRKGRCLAVPLALAATLLAARAPAAGAGPEGGAPLVAKEFAAAIRKVTPATVICVAKGAPKGWGGSSGVLISKDGYVLSDRLANYVPGPGRGAPGQSVGDVEVRVPEAAAGGKPPSSRVYAAKVVRRVDDDQVDSCLLKIVAPPSSGFPFVVVSTSNDLRVGAFTFAVGDAFGSSEEGTPTLTAGIVASLVRAPAGDPGGKNLEIYTSAAVNPGVVGGPLVDVEGMLVGLISTWITPSKEKERLNPFQFLGKAIPIDRVRAAYKDLPEAATIFPDPKTLPPKSKQAELLERALEAAARRAYPSVASLEVARRTPLRMRVPQMPGADGLPRYGGPVSGVVVSADGYIVTALYNLANTIGLAEPGAPNDVEKDLKEILQVTAHFSDGQSAPARLVAHDQRLGIACVKADLSGYAALPPEASPASSFDVGRIVLCVANPFGRGGNPDPFVTMGIVSRSHPLDAKESWRGDFQTDAGMTDGNAGGALVDLRGRVLGLAVPWLPARHGRNSGIGFGVPWERILQALPSLEAGTSVRFGFLGVKWVQDEGSMRVLEVVHDAAADKAGLRKDDKVVAVDGKPVKDFGEAQAAIRAHVVGDKVMMTVLRDGKPIELEVVLGSPAGA